MADTALTGSSAIELVGAGTLGPSGTGQVKVPSVVVTTGGTRSGRVAWWIGDQGVKAALATQAASKETTLGVLRDNLQSAPRNAVELAAAGARETFRRPRYG